MKLYTFKYHNKHTIGVEKAGKLIDLQLSGSPLCQDMLSFIIGAEEALDIARGLLAKVEPEHLIPFAEVQILAPLVPGKILCSGVNYQGHFNENPNAKHTAFPFFFSKLPSCVIGPGEAIRLPPQSLQVDYEVEFAVVFGKKAFLVGEDEIMDHVFGYTIQHDVSGRDVQFQDNQITLGKNFETFSPLGPCIVTKDEIPHPEKLKLRTLVNGVALQDSSNEDWVHRLPYLLSYVTQYMAWHPGDIVTTGTPEGTGFFRNPQVFLQDGDTVVCEIEGIGRLENPVIRAK